MNTNIPQELIVVQVEGESYMDSRLIAKELDIEHESFTKSIHTYQADLEDFGLVRFQIGAVREAGSRGTKHTKYVMLNEDQALFAITFSKNTKEALASKKLIIKLFSAARKEVARLKESGSTQGFTNQLWLDRARLFSQHTKIPYDMFCIFLEIYQTFFNFTLRGYKLPEGRVPDGSVGSRWAAYARNVLKLDMSLARMYDHIYPDQRKAVKALIYPIAWLPQFRIWFHTIYIPENLPEYMKYLKASKEETHYVLEGLGYTYQIESRKYQED